MKRHAGDGLPVRIEVAPMKLLAERALARMVDALVADGLPRTLAEEAVGLRKPPGSKQDAERYAKALAKR